MGLVFAGEVYGGSGGLGYFKAYPPSRKLNADIAAAETSVKIRINLPFVKSFTHTEDTEPPIHRIGGPLFTSGA